MFGQIHNINKRLDLLDIENKQLLQRLSILETEYNDIKSKYNALNVDMDTMMNKVIRRTATKEAKEQQHSSSAGLKYRG